MPDKWWAPATLFVGGIIVLRALDRLDTNLGLVDGGPKGGRKHTQSDKVQSAMGQTLLNASELIAVCLIWTGCEWFIWDGFLFHETCTRDSLYALVGFAVLLCTGTFVSLAGTVSPMGVYGRVHQKLQNNEEPLDLDSPDYSEDASFWEPAWPYERIDMDWHFSV
ncbi:hypothetical protein JKP88DRAFT_21259 [Tribonema minus]|uniref:Uncharacterized protein n=1 Tax=Tribonema minus TaxID=303371 RepID=A0A835Z909_9STRA|nr:hypothetical protein JKP88DRAFT_21259 [Tribonema minus]